MGVWRRTLTFKLVLQELPVDSAFLADSYYREGDGSRGSGRSASCVGITSVVFTNPVFC